MQTQKLGLGESLYRAMEWLEPDGINWADLSEGEREFWELAMERALEGLGYVPQRIEAGQDVVVWRVQRGE